MSREDYLDAINTVCGKCLVSETDEEACKHCPVSVALNNLWGELLNEILREEANQWVVCENIDSEGLERELEKFENSNPRTRAQRRKDERNKKAKEFESQGYRKSGGFSNWMKINGSWEKVGTHMQYPSHSRRQKYYKNYSNRKVRRNKDELFNGKSYRKQFDYAWKMD